MSLFKGFKERPLDERNNPFGVGSEGFAFEIVSDGSWQAVQLPIECKLLSIACRDDQETYNHIGNEQEFHFSFYADGTAWDYTTRIKLEIGKDENETIGYVRAPAGLKFIIMGIF